MHSKANRNFILLWLLTTFFRPAKCFSLYFLPSFWTALDYFFNVQIGNIIILHYEHVLDFWMWIVTDRLRYFLLKCEHSCVSMYHQKKPDCVALHESLPFMSFSLLPSYSRISPTRLWLVVCVEGSPPNHGTVFKIVEYSQGGRVQSPFYPRPSKL